MVGHREFMLAALREAEKARERGEVPVGCVVVHGAEIIGRGHNHREETGDPLAHAEMLALREAAKSLGSWRLDGCDLYVTLEPCAMCTGAMLQARIRHLIFGARDFKAGAAGSVFDLVRDPRLPHRLEVLEGICEEECRVLLSAFFQDKRF